MSLPGYGERVNPMNAVPLGDQAVLIYHPDEEAAGRFAEAIRRNRSPWVVDVVQAYTSVAVFFDLVQINFDGVVTILEGLSTGPEALGQEGLRRHRIPCCYELGPDLGRVAEHTGLGRDEVIRQHTSVEYSVYAIGFCPGFPYLGYLPQELCGVPRLPTPRTRVEPGSVGLTGRQTGIYPLPRPGGWNLIGRTPLVLVDVADSYFPIRTGDRVRFERIDEVEFDKLKGERL